MTTPTTAIRALEALPHLVRCAQKHQTITYGELAKKMRIPNPRTLAWPLWFIRDDICLKRGFPMINAIVVSKSTGLPGKGFLPPGESNLKGEAYRRRFEEVRDEVFEYAGWDRLLKRQ